MAASRTICVFGATGNQGGGVVQGLLKYSQFKIRGVTRNPSSSKAIALQEKGVEMVQANLDDASTIAKAVTGCHGVFGVTNFWEHMDQNKEVKQGSALVDACKSTGVKHLIFSGLESVKDHIGKACPHFDGKGEIEKYMFASDVPSTSVRYAAFMENFMTQIKATTTKDADGNFLIGMPMEGKKVDHIYAFGAGNAVAAIFASPDKYIGKPVGLSGSCMTVQEYADILSKHLAPKIFKAGPITVDQFAKLGFPGADDLAAMFDFLQRGNPDRDMALTKELDPTTQNFDDWVQQNKDALDAIYV